MAQSCLYPGFATLFTNFFRPNHKKVNDFGNWKEEYAHGAEFSLFNKKLSSVFEGVSFTKAANVGYIYTF